MNPDFLQRLPGFDWSVCDRVLAGDGSPEDRARVLAWFAQAPELHALVAGVRAGAAIEGDDEATVRAVRRRLAQITTSTDTAISEAPVRNRAPAASVDSMTANDAPSRTWRGVTRPSVSWGRSTRLDVRRVWRQSWAIAASALLLAGGWTASVLWHRASDNVTSVASYTTYHTTRGQRSSVTLRDGTKVTLGVASTLRVPADFGVGSRQIALDGEAYFDVAHDGGTPFVVRSGGARAVVLGTSFGVRKYAEDTAVRVAVASGRVEVDSVVLNGGDVARWTNGRMNVLRDVRMGPYLGWVSGRLAFENVPLRSVLHDLSRWYDVHLECDPSVADEPVSTVILNRSPEDAVRALAVLFNLDVRRQGDTIRLIHSSAR